MPEIKIIIPCFNAARSALSTAAACRALTIPAGIDCSILIVDDGSTDDSARVLAAGLHSTEYLLLGTNLGRAGAINSGVRVSASDWIMILDADCMPIDDRFLIAHIDTLSNGSDVSVGRLVGSSSDFWGRYFQRAAGRRERMFSAEGPSAVTTANIALSREVFLGVGGFDVEYRRYGFEDRDLFIRLSKAGASIGISSSAIALHSDSTVCLDAVMRKMREAGEHTAGRFRAKNPNEYALLGYRAVDCRDSWPLPQLLCAVDWFASPLARFIEPALQSSLIPFAARAFVAKLLSGASFARGTKRALD